MAEIPQGFEIVALDAGRLQDVLELDLWAFPSAETVEDWLPWTSPLSWERTSALVETGHPERLAAIHSSYPFGACPVPGGRLPVAGLTWVGVHPQFRRRGLLTAMIGQHFEDCRDRAEPVSLLSASEPAIYGRFGYGLASRCLTMTLRRGAALRPVAGTDELVIRMETASAERHGDLVARLHAASDRPGWVTRESPQLRAMWLSDPPILRSGREVARILIVERAGEPVAYALFRRKGEWGAAGPEGSVQVKEAVAHDPAAAHVLWARLLDLDLTTEVTPGILAVDDPLLDLLVDLRAARASMKDNVWARIIDLPAALAGRRYQGDIDVVLEVTDGLLPANSGRWHLTAPAFGEPQVRTTTTPADLELDVRELGAAYLGGTSLRGLAAAGLVTERTDGALARASVAFGWPQAPVSSWVF